MKHHPELKFRHLSLTKREVPELKVLGMSSLDISAIFQCTKGQRADGMMPSETRGKASFLFRLEDFSDLSMD
jgi:hypothetical protein